MKRDPRFKGTLPYASEVFGVYRPLLGWRSKRAEIWLTAGVTGDRNRAIQALRAKYLPRYTLDISADRVLTDIKDLAAGVPGGMPVQDTVLMREIQRDLPPRDKVKPTLWATLITEAKVNRLLAGPVRDFYLDWYEANAALIRRRHGGDPEAALNIVETSLRRESGVAGLLLAMQAQRMDEALETAFYGEPAAEAMDALAGLASTNPFDLIDPHRELDRVGLSPIGTVDLFREYFFAFGTFLGPAVGHVWISPGSTVELVEISTRRSLTERTTEQFYEFDRPLRERGRQSGRPLPRGQDRQSPRDEIRRQRQG